LEMTHEVTQRWTIGHTSWLTRWVINAWWKICDLNEN